ncbi:ABC transporter ATP-binding protein [Microbacterium sp. No. 7]|uniref:ABC transporter ATP-binding protein n=1 Tax=Microbacterium sp. No. 7 TaxID=1714373 RepID=UPI0006CFAF24|nr:ABC transporter ATP-binding protein [Microbacterium sp. No. 7]ALJ18438.1 ABC transporter ATP-binding protein [Microbacterium sp. No. 7]
MTEAGTARTDSAQAQAQAHEIVLESRGLTKTHTSTDPPTRVLDGIDLAVRDGEFLVVMGASGSGKSTLLYCISGMDRPTSGVVLLDGRELTSLSEAEMSRVRLTQMGFVFQQAHLLDNLSLRDNILLPALASVRRNRAASKNRDAPKNRDAAIARTDALMQRFGIDHVKTHGITQVSGGQLQRASICRALVCAPSILFADEPTGALNSRMTAEVMDALTDAHRDGTTVVMVTHDPACAVRGDRVVYLRDGRLVDARELGRWSPESVAERGDDLLAWLRGLGF